MAHRTNLSFAQDRYRESRRIDNRGEVLTQSAVIIKNLEKKFVFVVKTKEDKEKLTILWGKYDKYLKRDIQIFFKHPKCYKKRKYKKRLIQIRKKIVKVSILRENKKLDWVDLGVKR